MVMAGADFRATDLTYTERDGGEDDALDKTMRCPLCDRQYKSREGLKSTCMPTELTYRTYVGVSLQQMKIYSGQATAGYTGSVGELA